MWFSWDRELAELNSREMKKFKLLCLCVCVCPHVWDGAEKGGNRRRILGAKGAPNVMLT